jgi:P pilus assembly chaperone PapD
MRHHQQRFLYYHPPLFRLKAGEQGFVRILRSGKPLPEERESMFWLNIKGIPAMDSAPDKNMVQFAINSRIKLISTSGIKKCHSGKVCRKTAVVC